MCARSGAVVMSIPAAFHEAADKTNDAQDHDELHAAGAVLAMMTGMPYDVEYIHRWIGRLVVTHQLQ